MFSFHRPKVYRSSTGCCICKAKSSSSRFTDSKKYEEDFLECFQLSARRQGEICNACVLLVKRWKKLPIGSERNWRHVVDARAGPGMKSMTKFKSKQKKLLSEQQQHNLVKKTALIKQSPQSQQSLQLLQQSQPKSKQSREFDNGATVNTSSLLSVEDVEMLEDDIHHHGAVVSVVVVDSCNNNSVNNSNSGSVSGRSSCSNSPRGSDCEDAPAPAPGGNVVITGGSSRRMKGQAKRHELGMQHPALSDFIDEDYWKRETICCGIIFRGLSNEILVDPRFLKPCLARQASSPCKLLISSPLSSPNSDTELAVNNVVVAIDSTTTTTVVTTMSDAVVTATPEGKVFSDNSSDSGYDESSNPGSLDHSAESNNSTSDVTPTTITNSPRHHGNNNNNIVVTSTSPQQQQLLTSAVM